MGFSWTCLVVHFVLPILVASSQNCSDGQIRLTNTAYYIAGGLQLCVDSQWATVCHGSWDDLDAEVACKELEYHPGGTVLSVKAVLLN